MKYIEWQPQTTRIEQNYAAAFHHIIERFVEIYWKEVKKSPYFLPDLLKKFALTDIFIDWAHASAERMITALYTSSKRTWREAAKEATRGNEIYELLKKELQGPIGYEVRDLVLANAQVIKTFPLSIAQQVNNYIARETYRGRRASDIEQDILKQFPGVSKFRAALIARTEASKASTALTRARAERWGHDWFVWRTSKDARVRPSHRLMDRVLMGWDELPCPECLAGEKHTYGIYAPGDIWNCRCYPQVVINLDLLKWPMKFYRNGTLQFINRSQFEKLSEFKKAA